MKFESGFQGTESDESELLKWFSRFQLDAKLGKVVVGV